MISKEADKRIEMQIQRWQQQAMADAKPLPPLRISPGGRRRWAMIEEIAGPLETHDRFALWMTCAGVAHECLRQLLHRNIAAEVLGRPGAIIFSLVSSLSALYIIGISYRLRKPWSRIVDKDAGNPQGPKKRVA